MDSEQSRLYTSMLDQQLSQSMASRGVGLADIMMRQLRGRSCRRNQSRPHRIGYRAGASDARCRANPLTQQRPASGTAPDPSLIPGTGEQTILQMAQPAPHRMSIASFRQTDAVRTARPARRPAYPRGSCWDRQPWKVDGVNASFAGRTVHPATTVRHKGRQQLERAGGGNGNDRICQRRSTQDRRKISRLQFICGCLPRLLPICCAAIRAMRGTGTGRTGNQRGRFCAWPAAGGLCIRSELRREVKQSHQACAVV